MQFAKPLPDKFPAAIVALFFLLVVPVHGGQNVRHATAKAKIPAPREVLGFTPGDDYKLASWAQMVDYFKKLSAASDRVRFQEIGKTTLGRPFVFATISSPANLAKLERYKEIQQKLADPRIFNSNNTE